MTTQHISTLKENERATMLANLKEENKKLKKAINKLIGGLTPEEKETLIYKTEEKRNRLNCSN